MAGVIFLMSLVCGGCGASRGGDEQNPEREELILWSYYETEAQQQGLDKLMKEFNGSQQKYEVSWEYVPMADFIKQLSVAVSRSTLPDLVLVDNPDMKNLVTTGLLADLTEELEAKISAEDYYDEVWTTVEYDGRVYGIPFCCNNTAIIYNRQMLKETGIEPPGTWEEFEAAAGLLTEKGEDGHYGFVMSAAAGEQGAFQFMPWLLATGADLQNPADERTAEAFGLMERLIGNGSMPNDCMNWSQTDVTRIFTAEKAAMIENGPWALPEIEASGLDYGICPFPAHTAQGVIVGGENFAVLEGKNVSGAVAFLEFCSQEAVAEEISGLMGNISPMRRVAQQFGEQNPTYQVFVNQMEYGISRKSIPEWKTVCKALTESLHKMFGSDSSSEDIWRKYQSELAGEERRAREDIKESPQK